MMYQEEIVPSSDNKKNMKKNVYPEDDEEEKARIEGRKGPSLSRLIVQSRKHVKR